MPDRERTHYPGCWKTYGHHDCAIELLGEVQETLKQALYLAVVPNVRYGSPSKRKQIEERQLWARQARDLLTRLRQPEASENTDD